MNGRAEITVWKGSLNFMVYKIDQMIKLDELESTIEKYNWNRDMYEEGWLADKSYFKSNDNNIASFLYSTFRKHNKLSNEFGYTVKIPEPTGLSFYLKEKLVIASTSSDSTLQNKVEKKMFNTVAALCTPIRIGYTPDFIFWLVYKHDNKYIKITNGLIIEDVRAILTDIEGFNLSGSCGANTNVMKYTQAKALLALNGQVRGARLELKTHHEAYAFRFASDGRIISEKRDLIDNGEKVRYVLEIHNLLQEAYAEYNKIKDTNEWKKQKIEYIYNLFQECIGDFNNLSTELKNKKIP